MLLLLMATGLDKALAQQSKLRYADKQYHLENYAHAAEVYEQAFQKKESYPTAVRIAESYSKMRNYDMAYSWWAKVVAFENAGRDDYYQYLLAAMQAGKGMDAENLLKDSDFEAFDFPEIDFSRLQQLQAERANIKLVSLPTINSSGSDFGTSIDEEGNIYFTSDRGTVISSTKPAIRLDAKNNIFSKEKSDLNDREYFSLYRKDTAGNISLLNILLDKALHVSDPSITSDGKLIFFTAVTGQKKGNRREDIYNFPGIYFGELNERDEVENVQSLPANNLLEYGVMHPFVDESEGRLYFSSNMPGSFGGYDIYYVAFDSEMNFGDIVNLGPQVNTAGNESHPFRQEEDFFFSSDGHAGLGGLDIFKAKYSGGEFSEVQNIGVPYNSPRDDFAYYVDPNGKTYLSSDRIGGQGLDDVYGIEDLNKKLEAKLIDCDGNPIMEDFEILLTQDGSQSEIPTKIGDSNEILADLESESNYALQIKKTGFFSIKDSTLSTIGLAEDTLRRTYTLAKIPYQLPVYIDIVYYDLDKSAIRRDAEPILDKIGELMNKYAFLDLLVASHTDSRASHEYNEKLSERRADAVKAYLARYNVDHERIRLEWFGEENLVNKCADGINCSESYHQLNRRSELVLEAFPNTLLAYELPEEFFTQRKRLVR